MSMGRSTARWFAGSLLIMGCVTLLAYATPPASTNSHQSIVGACYGVPGFCDPTKNCTGCYSIVVCDMENGGLGDCTVIGPPKGCECR